MKYTLFVTQECNLRCSYCYIEKHPKVMSLNIAEKAIDFLFIKSLLVQEPINIGFFGGEPLLEVDRIQDMIQLIKDHKFYDPDRIHLSLVSNGTIFNDEIADFLTKNNISFGISCDGPSHIQDKFRVYKNGAGSSKIVEANIKKALNSLNSLIVNSVYHPLTFMHLPSTVKYIADQGIKQIYLTADYSANWEAKDIPILEDIYKQVGDIYMGMYREGNPKYINLIDNKISIMLKQGYSEMDKCRMGEAEFAISPEGNIFPCERLAGNGNNDHCIGNVTTGLKKNANPCFFEGDVEINDECLDCGIKDYCMNWCGCSNFMGTGFYNKMSAFQCRSEQLAFKESFRVFQILEKEMGSAFYEHVNGNAFMNSLIN